MRKKKLKLKIQSLEKQKQVLTLLLKLQTLKIENLKEQVIKMQKRQNNGLL